MLSHSRKGYSEVVWRQDTETFIRCLENAYRHFLGVTATLVVDNLKAAVLQADWYDPDLNPKLRVFCEHYGTALLPTKPAMPRHKGKIEAGVKYAQTNAVKDRTFTSLAEQNAFLAEWERTVADTRLHGTIRQQIGTLSKTGPVWPAFVKSGQFHPNSFAAFFRQPRHLPVFIAHRSAPLRGRLANSL